ncbi:N-acetylmuramoyl-L-alanine amidase family protein [Marinicrinis sediminis]|uniref:N-acetylmuramoyl-L-alanine amidase n=1 Tax=Marinicrinis sediminis TaxID=1652465 RepID=A0ABW5R5J5_9BACL
MHSPIHRLWQAIIVGLVALVCTQGVAAAWSEPYAEITGADRCPVQVDVMIDAGHGGVDGGASYGRVLEKDLNLAIARRLYRTLQERGYRTILNRDRDVALSEENEWHRVSSRHLRDLSQRKHLAMTVRPKLLLSLHMNVSRDPRDRGPWVIYQHNRISYEAATIVQHHLNRLYDMQQVARMGKPYYLLRQDLVPAMIVEMGFISNPQDRSWLMTPHGQEQMAAALGDAMDEIFYLMY